MKIRITFVRVDPLYLEVAEFNAVKFKIEDGVINIAAGINSAIFDLEDIESLEVEK